METKATTTETPTPEIYIFLDLDGVMADFDLHAHNEGKYTGDGKLNWDALDRQWWSSMPACEGAREFYDAAKAVGIVKFLTAPVMSAECFSGKAQWVQDFLPERGKFALMDLILCPSRDKHCLAGPGRVLVDDREKNVEEWNAAGGVGIHHDGDFSRTLKYLQHAIEKISGHGNEVRQTAKPVPPSSPGL